MDTQSIANALLLLPATIFGIIAFRARRRGQTQLGLRLGRGALREFCHGAAFATVMVALVFLCFWAGGLLEVTGLTWDFRPLLGILAYFLVLFTLEEIVFRGFLMTGLGVVTGRLSALLLTSLVVALPYMFSEGSGIVPLIGALATNLVNGLARWRTGRIWFGVGMRFFWNGLQVALGFAVSGYLLGEPIVRQHPTGPDLLTGGSYGPEGGLIGLGVRIMMLVYLARFVGGRFGPWVLRRARRVSEG